MLKKRKHKIKLRNTEPTVNHPLVLATGSASGAESVGATSAAYGVHAVESIPEHPDFGMLTECVIDIVI